MQAWLALFSAEVEEGKSEGGRPTGTAAEEGANQVPLPVTPTDCQGKHLDENMAAALRKKQIQITNASSQKWSKRRTVRERV